MVFAFGHPWGQRNIVTRGIVSAVLSAQTRNGERFPVIRSDATLAPGNSGGPLVNASGEVIGLNAMIMGGDQSLAISISVAREFVIKVLAENKAESKRPVPDILSLRGGRWSSRPSVLRGHIETKPDEAIPASIWRLLRLWFRYGGSTPPTQPAGSQ
jgi:S1-C subfamily serine protease